MIEQKRKEVRNEKLKETAKDLAIGAAVGTAVGAITGLLFAPKSGKETREDIADKGLEIAEAGREKAELVKEKAELVKDKAIDAYEWKMNKIHQIVDKVNPKKEDTIIEEEIETVEIVEKPLGAKKKSK